MKSIRKILSVILGVIMMFGMIIPAFAEGEEGITWTWDEQTKTLAFSGRGDMADADMSALSEAPTAETLQNMMPYGYGEHVLDAEHVVIGEGITGIGAYGFAYFFELETVSLPSTLTSIGVGAFYFCFSLQEMIIPDSVSSIGMYAFMLNLSLTKLVLPDNAGITGSYLSQSAIIDEVVIPASVGQVYIYAQVATLTNNSPSAVVIPEPFIAWENRALFTAYYKTVYKAMLNGIDMENPEDEAAMAFLVQSLNDELGTSYTREEIEDIFNTLGSGTAGYGDIFCVDGSAQHSYCAANYLPHKLIGETELHTSCFSYGGSYQNQDGNTITWALDTDTGVLTVNGEGTIYPSDSSARLWRVQTLERMITGIVFSEGITSITTELINHSVSQSINLTIPSTVTYIDERCFYSAVFTFDIDENNTEYCAEDGFLYRRLDDWNISEYAAMGIADAQWALVYYSRAADSWTPIAGTVEMRNCRTDLESVTIPDGIVKADLNGTGKARTIYIGKDLRTASRYYTWYNGPDVEAVVIDPENPYIKADDKFIYSKDGETLISWIHCASGEYHIPDEVKYLASDAFWWDGQGVPGEKVEVYITNRECTSTAPTLTAFSANWSHIEDVFVIHGYEGSAIQALAQDRGIPFAVIEEKEVAGVAILTPPDKTDYAVGASRLLSEGLTFEVTFSDGTTATRDAGYVLSGFDSSAAGANTITLTYEGKTATFDITIRAPRSYVIHEEETIDVEFDAEEEVGITYVCETSGTRTLFSASLTNDYYPYIAEYNDAGNKIYETYYNGENGNFTYSKYFEAGKTYHFGVHTGYGEAGRTKVTLAANHVHEYSDEYVLITSQADCRWSGYGYKQCACGMGMGERIPEKDHKDDDLNSVCDWCGTQIGVASYAFTGEVDEYIDAVPGLTTVVYYTAPSEEARLIADGSGEFVNHDKNWFKCYIDTNVTEELIQLIPGDVYRISLTPDGENDKIHIVIHAHEWEIVETINPGSCKQMGTAKFTCAGCGGEKTDFTDYDETVHLHTETVGAAEPTCGEAGYTGDVVCTDCRKTVSTGEIRPATGEHSWELTETLTPASCKTEGQGKFECTGCDAEKTDSIGFNENVHLHTKTVGAAAPTCGRAGYTGDVVCEDCGAPISTGQTIQATGEHTYGDWSTVKEPTATETGEKVRVCGVCGDTQRETIPATGAPADQPSDNPQQSNCVCGGYHTGPFAWLVKFIHRISYFFRNLFN